MEIDTRTVIGIGTDMETETWIDVADEHQPAVQTEPGTATETETSTDDAHHHHPEPGATTETD
jgi:hypothetical protein